MTTRIHLGFDRLYVIRHSDEPDSIGAYLSDQPHLANNHIFFSAKQWEVVAELAAALKAMHEATTKEQTHATHSEA